MKRLPLFLVASIFLSAGSCCWTSACWAATSKDSIWRIDGRLVFQEDAARTGTPRRIRVPGLFTPSSGFDISLASRPEDFDDVVRDLMPQRGTLLRVPLQNAKHKKNGTQAGLEVYRAGVVVRLKARF